jgi:shikimate dehydrogenase
MNPNLTGATRLNIIVGDPIKQVKAPGGMTRLCRSWT